MLKDSLNLIFTRFKINHYRNVFSRANVGDPDALSPMEVFCAEIIYGLNRPTLTMFARFLNVSQPNAAYKISKLESKGFVRKVQNEKDNRIIHLELTDKFFDMYSVNNRYADELERRLREALTEDEIRVFVEMMDSISDSIIKEIRQNFAKERKKALLMMDL